MPASQTLTAAVHREEDWYVAQCLEVNVASQGQTIDEALANLAEAVGLYLDEVDDPERWLAECGRHDHGSLARLRNDPGITCGLRHGAQHVRELFTCHGNAPRASVPGTNSAPSCVRPPAGSL